MKCQFYQAPYTDCRNDVHFRVFFKGSLVGRVCAVHGKKLVEKESNYKLEKIRKRVPTTTVRT